MINLCRIRRQPICPVIVGNDEERFIQPFDVWGNLYRFDFVTFAINEYGFLLGPVGSMSVGFL